MRDYNGMRGGQVLGGLRVFVYGHYDSRGGTTAVSAKDKVTADAIYNEELFSWSEMLTDESVARCLKHGWNPREDGGPAKWDFLYEARLYGYDGDEGELEEGDAEVWIHAADEERPLTSVSPPVRLLYVQTPDPELLVSEHYRRSAEWVHPQWDDDAFSFVLMYH